MRTEAGIGENLCARQLCSPVAAQPHKSHQPPSWKIVRRLIIRSRITGSLMAHEVLAPFVLWVDGGPVTLVLTAHLCAPASRRYVVCAADAPDILEWSDEPPVPPDGVAPARRSDTVLRRAPARKHHDPICV
jgi:hypothetical protein